MNITLPEQLACAERELMLRKRVYPRLIWKEKITRARAAYETHAMAAIVETLRKLLDDQLYREGKILFKE